MVFNIVFAAVKAASVFYERRSLENALIEKGPLSSVG